MGSSKGLRSHVDGSLHPRCRAIHYITPSIDAAHEKVDEVVAQLVMGAPGAQVDVKVLLNSAA